MCYVLFVYILFTWLSSFTLIFQQAPAESLSDEEKLTAQRSYSLDAITLDKLKNGDTTTTSLISISKSSSLPKKQESKKSIYFTLSLHNLHYYSGWR